MQEAPLQLFDMGLRIYHPPVLLDTRKYITLVEQLCDVYPTQRREADAFEFSMSSSQTARITPQMTSVGELFDGDPRGTTRRVFQVIGRLLEVLEVERIEAFDFVVSGRLKAQGEWMTSSYDDYPADIFIEKCFLKDVDFSLLATEGQKPSPGVNWIFDVGQKSVSLKVEPHADDREYVFVELSVQHPQSNISLGDIRAEVEQDLRYLRENVVPFLTHAIGSEKT